MACCKSCARVAGKGKRKNRSAGVGQIFKTMKGGKSRSQLVIQAAKIGGGFMLGQIVEQIGPLKNNKYLSAGAKVVGGIILAGMSNSTKEVAIGLAASGVVDIAQQITGGAASATGLGLLPYGGSGSSMLPGVAGDYTYNPGSGIMAVG